jgi:hypothetical protein
VNRRTLLTVVVAVAVTVPAGCSGSDVVPTATVLDEARCLDATPADAPLVELIAPAIAVTDAHYGSPQRYFEISADRQRVSLIVATESGDAEQVVVCDEGRFGPPVSLGPAEGATFSGDDVDVDAGRVLSGLDSELDDPNIVDFAVRGTTDGVLYDATIVSDAGGVLLVLLSGDGEVLAVQAE